MIWLHPLAVFALLGLVAPVLIHLLARRRAVRVAFPTLRFIQPFRLAAIRRRALDDAALLAVRAAIFAMAVGAVAGPFVLTAARQRAWDARVVRIELLSGGARSGGDAATALEVERAGDGIARAVAWLGTQPPGRREIVIRSAFPLGALTAADVAIVPANVGLRLERSGALPANRLLTAPSAIGFLASGPSLVHVDREVELSDVRTSVRGARHGAAIQSPVEIRAASGEQAAADAVLTTLLAERIRAPHGGQSARLVLAGSPEELNRIPVAPIAAAWMADASAWIARDLSGRGWSRPRLRFGADGSRLIVLADVHASDPAAAAIIRSVADSIGEPVEQPAQEIAAIPDDQLRAWSRPAGPAAPPRPESVGSDDRRWLWGVVLVLLLCEARMRRARVADAAAGEEVSRVA